MPITRTVCSPSGVVLGAECKADGQIGPRTLARQPVCCLRQTRAPQLPTQLAGAHPPAAPTGPAAQAPPAELRALGRADVVFAVVVCAVDNSRALSARARSLCAMVAQPTKAKTSCAETRRNQRDGMPVDQTAVIISLAQPQGVRPLTGQLLASLHGSE